MKEVPKFKKGYLILERSIGDGFHIGEDCEVIIAHVNANKIYLAVKAPGKKILRNEIMNREARLISEAQCLVE